MSRTAPFRVVKRAAQKAFATLKGDALKSPSPVVAGAWSRRQFVGSTALGALALSVPFGTGCGSDEPSRSIAIVGGGMAGLHCAYVLKNAGARATVYEASTRTGGRIYSARGMFADDQVIELGGELIDSNHVTMRALAAEFGLDVDDLEADTTGLRKDTVVIDGVVIDEQAIVDAFLPLAPVMAAAVEAAEEDDDLFATIDAMSIREWLDAQPEASDLIKAVLNAAYVGEYGRETDDQSIFNLLYLIDYEEADPFRIFGDSDERYHVRQGNDAITQALANEITGQIELEHKLTKLRKVESRYELTFEVRGEAETVLADHVVLTLPFTLLREVEIDADFDETKTAAIAEVAYGTNAKLMLGFSSRPWREDPSNASGSAFVDTNLQSLWETSRGQSGVSGVLTNFVGGNVGVTMGEGTPEERAMAVLPGIDAVFPGTQAAYRPNSAVRMHWPTHPFTKGSYACYRPGQWEYYGTEGLRQGNVHFAGEHTSLDFQGYMEGAAETGERVALEILGDLGVAVAREEALRRGPISSRDRRAFRAGIRARRKGR